MIVRVRSFIEGRGALLGGAGPRVRVRLLIEGVLVVLIAAQAVRLIVALLAAPAEAAPASPPAASVDLAALSRTDAFFRSGARSSLAEVTAAGTDQLRLFGVRAGTAGGGSAILGLADGRQLSVGVGEEIEPGLVLRSVAEDHVTVARGASVARVDFGEVPEGAAAPPPPPSQPQVVAPPTPAAAAGPAAQAAQAPVVDPQRLIGQASLRPRMKGMSISGFTVSAAGDGAALRAAGLRSGDVILAVNGVELNGMGALSSLKAELADASSVEIRFERDGRVQTTTIRTGR